MRAAGFLVGSTLFLMGCSQAIDYTYSKKNFTNSTFEADLSACRCAQPDDAMVRDCMKTKGYKINPPAVITSDPVSAWQPAEHAVARPAGRVA